VEFSSWDLHIPETFTVAESYERVFIALHIPLIVTMLLEQNDQN